MNNAIQIATLVSAVIGWLTVIVGGITVWNRVNIRLTELQGKVDSLCSDYQALRRERVECEEREQEVRKDHENRIRTLEKST